MLLPKFAYIFHKPMTYKGSFIIYLAEWAKIFGRAFRSGRKFLEVCFVVGEKFWVAKLAKMAISRYSK